MNRRLSPSYNCAHYATDLWEHETGQDLGQALSGFLCSRRSRSVGPELRHEFERLPAPRSPCIVLFRRGRTTPHVGVFLRGRVQHLTRSGPIRQLVAVAGVGYTSVRFYAPRSPVY